MIRYKDVNQKTRIARFVEILQKLCGMQGFWENVLDVLLH